MVFSGMPIVTAYAADGDILSSPQNLTAVGATDRSVSLAWDEPATRYPGAAAERTGTRPDYHRRRFRNHNRMERH